MFPYMLCKIKDFLINENIHLTFHTRDGRINSAFNEDEIIKIIAQNFKITLPKVRDWVDFGFEENGIFYPVNIKITTTKTDDNLNCKLGIYYALSGVKPTFSNQISYEKYFKNLRSKIQENQVDYYFLIINKNDMQDIFLASLKTLKHISPNGNNLPFQAKWDDNRIPQNRSFKEAKDFLMQCFGESLKLRSEAYFYFKALFNEYA